MHALGSIKRQYFLAFAVLGSLMYYLPLFLREQGLSESQIGDVAAVSSAAVILTPVLVTLLADAHLAHRRLLAAVFGGSAVMLTGVLFAEGFWPIALLYGLYSLTFVPVTSVQDGLNFSIQKQREEAGLAGAPYHRVRVWGTFGFILAGLLLYALLSWHDDAVWLALATAIGFNLVGLANSFTLPDTRTGKVNGEAVGRLPTLAAARAMLRPTVLVFCIAMWLLHLAAAAFYIFYAQYLTETIRINSKWVALITSIGVGTEIVFMLGYGLLLRRFGFKALMIVGLGSTALRLALMAAFPFAAVAVVTQVLHGPMVLALHVAPPTFLNSHAEERYRSSIQGLYAMLVFGTGRLVGSLIAGRIAEHSVRVLFAYAGGLCVTAAALMLIAFREKAKAAVAPDGRS